MSLILHCYSNHQDDEIVYHDMFFLSEDEKQRTYSEYYYIYEPEFVKDDYNCAKKVTIDVSETYIARSKVDIDKNLFDSKGVFQLQRMKRSISAVIIFDGLGVKPIIKIYDISCIKDISVFKSKDIQNRRWLAQEECSDLKLNKCIDGDTCHWSKGECVSLPSISRLKFEQLGKIMKPYKYYAFSEVPLQGNIKTTLSSQKKSHKPIGLWFAVGDKWLTFLKKYMDFKRFEYNYLYEVELQLDKLYQITSLKHLLEFSQTFKEIYEDKKILSTTSRLGMNDSIINIDWVKITKHTNMSGILIPYDFKGLYKKYGNKSEYNEYFKQLKWYKSWDIPSGAIWKSDGVKSIKLLYRKEQGSWINTNMKVINLLGGINEFLQSNGYKQFTDIHKAVKFCEENKLLSDKVLTEIYHILSHQLIKQI